MGLLEIVFGRGSKKRIEDIISSKIDFRSAMQQWDDYLSIYKPGRTRRNHDLIRDHLVDKAVMHIDADPDDKILEDYALTDISTIVTQHEVAAGAAMSIAEKIFQAATSYGQEISYSNRQWQSLSDEEKNDAVKGLFRGVQDLSALKQYTAAGDLHVRNFHVLKSAALYLSYLLDDVKSLRADKMDYESKKDRMTVIERNYIAVRTGLKYRSLVEKASDFRSKAEEYGVVFEADILKELSTREQDMDIYFRKGRDKAPDVLNDCMREVIYCVQKITAGNVGGTVLSELSEKLGIINDIVKYYSLPMPKEMKHYESRLQNILGIYS